MAYLFHNGAISSIVKTLNISKIMRNFSLDDIIFNWNTNSCGTKYPDIVNKFYCLDKKFGKCLEISNNISKQNYVGSERKSMDILHVETSKFRNNLQNTTTFRNSKIPRGCKILPFINSSCSGIKPIEFGCKNARKHWNKIIHNFTFTSVSRISPEPELHLFPIPSKEISGNIFTFGYNTKNHRKMYNISMVMKADFHSSTLDRSNKSKCKKTKKVKHKYKRSIWQRVKAMCSINRKRNLSCPETFKCSAVKCAKVIKECASKAKTCPKPSCPPDPPCSPSPTPAPCPPGSPKSTDCPPLPQSSPSPCAPSHPTPKPCPCSSATPQPCPCPPLPPPCPCPPPCPPSVPCAKTASVCPKKDICEGKRPSYWRRFINYFKARPNCPTPAEYRKKKMLKRLRRIAERANLGVYDPCDDPCDICKEVERRCLLARKTTCKPKKQCFHSYVSFRQFSSIHTADRSDFSVNIYRNIRIKIEEHGGLRSHLTDSKNKHKKEINGTSRI